MIVKRKISTLFLIVVFLLDFLTFLPLKVSAEEVTYSNVLDDLQKDPDFDPIDYPAKADDFSLQVIQLAEGDNGELFVYVYQPSAKFTPLVATSINISQEHKDIKFYNYTLTLLNQKGVLQKYIVDDFTVKKDSNRYYEITSIYRKPIDDSEKVVDNGNLIDEVNFKVAKSFKITDKSDGRQEVYVEDL